MYSLILYQGIFSHTGLGVVINQSDRILLFIHLPRWECLYSQAQLWPRNDRVHKEYISRLAIIFCIYKLYYISCDKWNRNITEYLRNCYFLTWTYQDRCIYNIFEVCWKFMYLCTCVFGVDTEMNTWFIKFAMD